MLRFQPARCSGPARSCMFKLLASHSCSQVPCSAVSPSLARDSLVASARATRSETGKPMGRGSKQKWYAVAVGYTPGVYRSWHDCQEQVNGYRQAVYKAFSSKSEAEDFVYSRGGGSSGHYIGYCTVSRPAASDHAYVFFDGGSRGNPGRAGCGACLKYSSPDATPADDRYAYIGTATNNVAEYEGLILALQLAQSHGVRSVSVRGDSELIMHQLNGRYQVRNAGLKPLFDMARYDLLPWFDSWDASHVPRRDNKWADDLANRAMDEYMEGVHTPSTDGLPFKESSSFSTAY